MSVALTTTFTPPARCTTDKWRMTYDLSQGLYYGLLGGGGYSSCMPKSFTPDPTFFYSPGFYCPVGYSTACSTTQVIGSETATLATCCPTGFSCQQRSREGAWPWEFTLGCTSACQSSYAVTYTDSSTLIDDSCAGGRGINAYSVQLRFRSADLVTTSSAASSTPFSTSAVTGSTPTSNAPTNTGTSSPSSDGGFSTGAKVGVGVGSVLGVALIAAICWLAWILHKKSKKKHQDNNHDQTELYYQSPTQHYPKDANAGASHYAPIHDPSQYRDDNVQYAHEAHADPMPKPEPYELPAGR